GPSKIVTPPTCMWETGDSCARNEASTAVSRSRCCWAISSSRSSSGTTDIASLYQQSAVAAHLGHHRALMSVEVQLAEEVRAHYGADARVEELVPLAGGASRELYGFDVVDGAERHELVLRADPPEVPESDERARELSALRTAYEGGVPVPAPHWLTGDGRGIVMQRVHGEAIARRLLRDDRYATARERLTDEVARAAAALHALPAPEGLPVMGTHGAVAFVEEELDRLRHAHPARRLRPPRLR